MPFARSALFVLSSAALLAAQSPRVVPGPAATEDGDTLSAAPFGYTEIRCQQVWEADALTSGVAVLFGMAMRPDANTQNEAGRTYSSFTITAGHSANGPTSLSGTFASNFSGTPTMVFQGQYSLPSQGTFTAPGPFNISWMFSAPFVYDRALGNLLIEIVGHNVQNKSNYFVDATGADGSGPFGTSGPMSNGDMLTLSGPGANPVPTGQLVFRAETQKSSYPSALLLGVDATSINAVPLPFDLGAIGAPNNSLYVNALLVLPWTLKISSNGFAATQTFGVPNNPTLNGVGLYGQTFVKHPASNAAGIVTSNAYEYRIGATAPVTGQVLSYDPNSPTGNPQPDGPVVQFSGVFP